MHTGQDRETFGRARLSFADEADIDEFVSMLTKFERGDITRNKFRMHTEIARLLARDVDVCACRKIDGCEVEAAPCQRERGSPTDTTRGARDQRKRASRLIAMVGHVCSFNQGAFLR